MNSTPTSLGKYQIIREIARSNDIVYEAYDPQMNRRVAVKELAIMKGVAGQQLQDRIDRFKREARAAGTISHPNIMTVYELGEDGDHYYIAMEFLDGCTLRNEIDTKGSLPEDRAVKIAIEVLKGLAFAHSKGVIHRDVKPDNIQILTDGRIKLTDFGIARLTFEPNLTMDGQVFGTPSYMSPEQIIGKEIDARSDIFSLGVVLYETIEGRKPFPGDSVVSITHAITSLKMQPTTAASYAVSQVIERAVDKVPPMRFASAEEMISALEVAVSANAPQPPNPYGYQDPDPYNYQNQPGYYAPPMQQPQNYGPAIQAPPPVIAGQAPYYGQPIYGQQMPPQVYVPQQYGGQVPYSQNPQMYGNYSPDPYGLNGTVPMQQVPVYYPPPPSRSLISQETREFLGKLFTTLLIGLTVIVVLFLIIRSIAQTIQVSSQEQSDQNVASAVNNEINPLPVSQKIDRLNAALQTIKSPVIRYQENEKLGQCYADLAEQSFQSRDYDSAESWFQVAQEKDPTNISFAIQLSQVYNTVAQQVQDVQQKSMLWNKTIQTCQTAEETTQDDNQKQQLANSAAMTSVSWAQSLAKSGNLFDARQKLIQAQNFDPSEPGLSGQIRRLLREYENRSIEASSSQNVSSQESP